MGQLPRDDDTPFSLPKDVHDTAPIDYPGINGNADAHEVYDEGLEASMDFDPYSFDDDPIKSSRRTMQNVAAKQNLRYTLDHDLIKRWSEFRYGHPARVASSGHTLGEPELYIYFEDNVPDVEIVPISWHKFFTIFERFALAFVFGSRTDNGDISHYYRFIKRRAVRRLTSARRSSS